jgi:2-polyprenyl-6-methoxyphenol hydroxylase-like FAD-dependent oxidoreductase
MATKKTNPDFLIVGAGIAGSALAVGLHQKGFNVCLVEREAAPRDRFKGEYLQPFAVKELIKLGFEELLCGPDTQKIYELQFRDLNSHNEVVSSVIIPYLADDFAAVVPHKDLITGLQKRAGEVLGDRLLLGTTAEPANAGDADFLEHPRFLLKREGQEPIEVAPRFVIGCDGRQSVVRSWMGGPKAPAMGSPTFGIDPEFIVGAELHGARDLPNRYEVIRTSGKGTLALFQTRPETQRLYWNAPATPGSNKKSWENSLNGMLPDLKQLADLESTQLQNVSGSPADQVWFGPASSGAFFLVGDALAVTSPLGGQGMNCAMREVAHLLERFEENQRGDTSLEAVKKGYALFARGTYNHVCLLNFGLYYLFFASGRLLSLVSRFILQEWNSSPAISARVGELFSGMSWDTPRLGELLRLWGIFPMVRRVAFQAVPRPAKRAIFRRSRFAKRKVRTETERFRKTS